MGDHVHNALKLFYRLPQEKRTKRALIWLLDEHWKKKSGRSAGFWNEQQEAEYKERAHLMLSAYADREDVTIEPLWASDKLIKTGVNETLEFMGKIDRVDETADGLHIIDYKTSKEEREDEWQLPMYAVMAKQFFGKPVAQLSYVFLETGTWLSVPANPMREAMTVSRVQQLIDSMPRSMKREDWLCPDGQDCTHCNYLKEFGIDPLGEIVTMPQSTVIPSP
jgi:RecB family exonuclease